MNKCEQNKELTRTFIEAIGRGDAQYIADTYADDGRLHTMGHTLISGVYDKATIREFAGSGLHIHASLLDADGNNVFSGQCKDGDFSDTLHNK